MQRNADDMMADGWTQEEIDAQMTRWNADVERCHKEALTQLDAS